MNRSSSHAQRVCRLDPVEVGDEAELHHLVMLGAVLIGGRVDRALSAELGMCAEEQPIFDVVHLLLNVEVSERGTGVIALQLLETTLQGVHVLFARRPSLRGLEQLVAELGVVLDPRLDLLEQEWSQQWLTSLAPSLESSLRFFFFLIGSSLFSGSTSEVPRWSFKKAISSFRVPSPSSQPRWLRKCPVACSRAAGSGSTGSTDRSRERLVEYRLNNVFCVNSNNRTTVGPGTTVRTTVGPGTTVRTTVGSGNNSRERGGGVGESMVIQIKRSHP